MSQDFKDRLARLEAKHGKSTAPGQAAETPTAPKSKPTANSKGGMVKPILLGAAILVLLPATAILGTVVYSQVGGFSSATETTASNQPQAEVTETLSAGARALAIVYGPTADPERRDARRKMDGVMFRLNTGTMSEEEGKYWASDAGQMELAETNGKALNIEGLRKLGEELYLDK